MLSHGQKQWLEIGMLLVQDPRLLLLDEPVAGMSKDERAITGELLQRITELRTVVVVEHDMDFLRRFARTVTVMHEGRVLCEGSVAEVQEDPAVREVYLGEAARPGRGRRGAGGMLSIERLHVSHGRTRVLFGASLEVPSGGLMCVIGEASTN